MDDSSDKWDVISYQSIFKVAKSDINKGLSQIVANVKEFAKPLAIPRFQASISVPKLADFMTTFAPRLVCSAELVNDIAQSLDIHQKLIVQALSRDVDEAMIDKRIHSSSILQVMCHALSFINTQIMYQIKIIKLLMESLGKSRDESSTTHMVVIQGASLLAKEGLIENILMCISSLDALGFKYQNSTLSDSLTLPNVGRKEMAAIHSELLKMLLEILYLYFFHFNPTQVQIDMLSCLIPHCYSTSSAVAFFSRVQGVRDEISDPNLCFYQPTASFEKSGRDFFTFYVIFVLSVAANPHLKRWDVAKAQSVGDNVSGLEKITFDKQIQGGWKKSASGDLAEMIFDGLYRNDFQVVLRGVENNVLFTISQNWLANFQIYNVDFISFLFEGFIKQFGEALIKHQIRETRRFVILTSVRNSNTTFQQQAQIPGKLVLRLITFLNGLVKLHPKSSFEFVSYWERCCSVMSDLVADIEYLSPVPEWFSQKSEVNWEDPLLQPSADFSWHDHKRSLVYLAQVAGNMINVCVETFDPLFVELLDFGATLISSDHTSKICSRICNFLMIGGGKIEFPALLQKLVLQVAGKRAGLYHRLAGQVYACIVSRDAQIETCNVAVLLNKSPQKQLAGGYTFDSISSVEATRTALFAIGLGGSCPLGVDQALAAALRLVAAANSLYLKPYSPPLDVTLYTSSADVLQVPIALMTTSSEAGGKKSLSTFPKDLPSQIVIGRACSLFMTKLAATHEQAVGILAKLEECFPDEAHIDTLAKGDIGGSDKAIKQLYSQSLRPCELDAVIALESQVQTPFPPLFQFTILMASIVSLLHFIGFKRFRLAEMDRLVDKVLRLAAVCPDTDWTLMVYIMEFFKLVLRGPLEHEEEGHDSQGGPSTSGGAKTAAFKILREFLSVKSRVGFLTRVLGAAKRDIEARREQTFIAFGHKSQNKENSGLPEISEWAAILACQTLRLLFRRDTVYQKITGSSALVHQHLSTTDCENLLAFARPEVSPALQKLSLGLLSQISQRDFLLLDLCPLEDSVANHLRNLILDFSTVERSYKVNLDEFVCDPLSNLFWIQHDSHTFAEMMSGVMSRKTFLPIPLPIYIEWQKSEDNLLEIRDAKHFVRNVDYALSEKICPTNNLSLFHANSWTHSLRALNLATGSPDSVVTIGDSARSILLAALHQDYTNRLEFALKVIHSDDGSIDEPHTTAGVGAAFQDALASPKDSFLFRLVVKCRDAGESAGGSLARMLLLEILQVLTVTKKTSESVLGIIGRVWPDIYGDLGTETRGSGDDMGSAQALIQRGLLLQIVASEAAFFSSFFHSGAETGDTPHVDCCPEAMRQSDLEVMRREREKLQKRARALSVRQEEILRLLAGEAQGSNEGARQHLQAEMERIGIEHIEIGKRTAQMHQMEGELEQRLAQTIRRESCLQARIGQVLSNAHALLDGPQSLVIHYASIADLKESSLVGARGIVDNQRLRPNARGALKSPKLSLTLSLRTMNKIRNIANAQIGIDFTDGKSARDVGDASAVFSAFARRFLLTRLHVAIDALLGLLATVLASEGGPVRSLSAAIRPYRGELAANFSAICSKALGVLVSNMRPSNSLFLAALAKTISARLPADKISEREAPGGGLSERGSRVGYALALISALETYDLDWLARSILYGTIKNLTQALRPGRGGGKLEPQGTCLGNYLQAPKFLTRLLKEAVSCSSSTAGELPYSLRTVSECYTLDCDAAAVAMTSACQEHLILHVEALNLAASVLAGVTRVAYSEGCIDLGPGLGRIPGQLLLQLVQKRLIVPSVISRFEIECAMASLDALTSLARFLVPLWYDESLGIAEGDGPEEGELAPGSGASRSLLATILDSPFLRESRFVCSFATLFQALLSRLELSAESDEYDRLAMGIMAWMSREFSMIKSYFEPSCDHPTSWILLRIYIYCTFWALNKYGNWEDYKRTISRFSETISVGPSAASVTPKIALINFSLIWSDLVCKFPPASIIPSFAASKCLEIAVQLAGLEGVDVDSPPDVSFFSKMLLGLESIALELGAYESDLDPLGDHATRMKGLDRLDTIYQVFLASSTTLLNHYLLSDVHKDSSDGWSLSSEKSLVVLLQVVDFSILLLQYACACTDSKQFAENVRQQLQLFIVGLENVGVYRPVALLQATHYTYLAPTHLEQPSHGKQVVKMEDVTSQLIKIGNVAQELYAVLMPA
ncbi:hypothetical protein BmR1_04g09715 [Babesia microti strain RI]|uniref:Uncharacterized protein n=1 Tax=Babesia microti (strain RI) TaxID=1133968 RepID=A0A1N6LYH1_BABMR|nr:hypothetical protein BmR1_04g09715 [Babesia microti strain RI]SIO73917.1 hypothetical protein BmR1_04g09715 [Babesia microti strain RI]|eukprot:XP_021337966.1 hypothetical protein BmR1_04g09715 [Babesia microti strain RI]